ncbi:hypothetical protein BDZ94DRAFT_726053 [Collybia nuda]|uniref:Uncharacterized protein n=1 Tax=Collybia nuda TaxID=64659 RepID=A0A9P6CDZ9_9AGAR|nr:hypothetical protein BDZ94DRAFT_726053 [Collybia nuda]
MIVFHYDPVTFPKGTMIQQTPIGPPATESTHPMSITVPPPVPFPSPPLVLINIISCFLATAAFGSSLTQINTWSPWTMSILPSIIGLLATVPFYIFLYRFALGYARAASKGLLGDTSFLPMWAFVYIFVLVALWLVIFIVNILCTADYPLAGMIISTIFAGCESLVSALLAIKCVWESWDAEDISKNPGNLELPLGVDAEGAVTSDDATLNSLLLTPRPTPKYLYLVSWILATLAFISSISPRLNLMVTVPTYLLTVMLHVPLFVSSGSSRRAITRFPFESVGISSFLLVLWCDFVLANTLIRIPRFQKVLSGIFGVMECIVAAYIVVKRIMESLSPPENQIHLQGD